MEAIKIYRSNDPAIVRTLMFRDAASIRDVRQRIGGVSGDALFEFIVDDVKKLRDELYSPRRMGVVYAGLYAQDWVNKHLDK